MATRKFRKAINFDLGTNELKAIFGEDTRPAYLAIKKYLLKNGFEHRQYSGYFSMRTMEDADIAILINTMSKELPWMRDCLQKIDVTNVYKSTDMLSAFKDVDLDVGEVEIALTDPLADASIKSTK
jgi:virulence-associated protein VapD